MSERARPPNACPMDAILNLLMGPWTTYILWLLYTHGALRFGALKALIPRVSSKVLTERLRHLAAAGLVHRDYQPTIPPSVTYSLTPRGIELRGVLDALDETARRWAAEDDDAPRSGDMGDPVPSDVEIDHVLRV